MLYALILCLYSLFNCLLYHGNDRFCVIIFLGMCLSIVSCTKSCSLVQFVSTELAIGSVLRKRSLKSAKSWVMVVVFCVVGLMFLSMSTIRVAWSLKHGSACVRVIKEVLFVRSKSSMLDVTPFLMLGLCLPTPAGCVLVHVLFV